MAVPPKHVVRFYGTADYAIQTIGFREITFVHIAKLNDPFDPHVFFTTEFDDNYAILVDYVKQNHKDNLQTFVDRLPQHSWKQFLSRIAEIFDSIRRSTFLFSTNAVHEQKHPKDNLYMWAHYGNGHRGIAIEFDTNLLTKAVSAESTKQLGEETNIDEAWNDINYTPSLPKITCESIFQFVISATEKPDEAAWDHTELIKIIKLMVRSKSAVWEPEDEWRLMWSNKETKLKIQRLDLLDNTITAAYLGCRAADSLTSSLLSEIKHSFPGAAVFKGKTAKGDFALEFERLY